MPLVYDKIQQSTTCNLGIQWGGVLDSAVVKTKKLFCPHGVHGWIQKIPLGGPDNVLAHLSRTFMCSWVTP